MELFLKNTQTSIGSWISSILSNIYRIKPKVQVEIMGIIFSIFILHFVFPIKAFAITDPLSVANNRFGIHIISGVSQEASESADLVNSTGGDWGYVTLIIESKDRDVNRWQQFFNELRRRHLIPIVRLATKPVSGGYWEVPYEKEYEAWADFLNNLNWPTKNRYIIIYNEPNHATEWGNNVDPISYAHVLNDTIDALKQKSPDFFILNAGFDASTPHQPPNFYDEAKFLVAMDQEIPGIFNKLDGWVSHSYPNPGFIGSPDGTGRGSVRTYTWELGLLRNFNVTKNLPVFITETGWKHAEGLKYDATLPSVDKVGEYFKKAFQEAWNDRQIVAVTPFLLNYQDAPFDHFSFKKIDGEKQEKTLLPRNVLGVHYPEDSNHYSDYLALQELPKNAGHPKQANQAELTKGTIYNSLAGGQSYNIQLTFKNTGNSIWNEYGPVKLQIKSSPVGFDIPAVILPSDQRIEPGQEYSFNLKVTAPLSGDFKLTSNLYQEGQEFDSKPFEFTTEIKSPVSLIIKTALKWKENFAGDYFLIINGVTPKSSSNIQLTQDGTSREFETSDVLPDYSFDFTLQKPFYYPKTIHQQLFPGTNILDFGEMQPNITSAILKPLELWKLLPFSK